ncbi:hypothetical protein HOY80DRAFT_985048 [Tuber brumale]|nr:hypothetical protein HOY80DRAFT_985048 [Tuber brumale]
MCVSLSLSPLSLFFISALSACIFLGLPVVNPPVRYDTTRPCPTFGSQHPLLPQLHDPSQLLQLMIVHGWEANHTFNSSTTHSTYSLSPEMQYRYSSNSSERKQYDTAEGTQ